MNKKFILIIFCLLLLSCSRDKYEVFIYGYSNPFCDFKSDVYTKYYSNTLTFILKERYSYEYSPESTLENVIIIDSTLLPEDVIESDIFTIEMSNDKVYFKETTDSVFQLLSLKIGDTTFIDYLPFKLDNTRFNKFYQSIKRQVKYSDSKVRSVYIGENRIYNFSTSRYIKYHTFKFDFSSFSFSYMPPIFYYISENKKSPFILDIYEPKNIKEGNFEGTFLTPFRIELKRW